MNPAPASTLPSAYDSGLAAIRAGQRLIESAGAAAVGSALAEAPVLAGWPEDSHAIGRALLDSSIADALSGRDEAAAAADFFRGRAQVEAGIAIIAAADHTAQIVIDLIDPHRRRRCACRE